MRNYSVKHKNKFEKSQQTTQWEPTDKRWHQPAPVSALPSPSLPALAPA